MEKQNKKTFIVFETFIGETLQPTIPVITSNEGGIQMLKTPFSVENKHSHLVLLLHYLLFWKSQLKVSSAKCCSVE